MAASSGAESGETYCCGQDTQRLALLTASARGDAGERVMETGTPGLRRDDFVRFVYSSYMQAL